MNCDPDQWPQILLIKYCETVTFSTKQLPQINFASLITQYTREFRTGYVEAAVNYFTLICLNADLPGELGKSQASVCHEALREFILETRDFALLLGDIRSDGTRIKGAIERRLKLIKLIDQEEFLKTITVQAAAVADDKGLITDAVLLYHLAEEYDNVISVINRALADAIAVDLGDSAMKLQPLKPRTTPSSQEQPQQPQQASSTLPEQGSSLSLTAVDDPVVLAKNMIGLYNTNALYYQKIHQINRDACGLLLRTMEAKANVAAGKWAQALDVSISVLLSPLPRCALVYISVSITECALTFFAFNRISTISRSSHCEPRALSRTSAVPRRHSHPFPRSSPGTPAS